MAPDSRWFPTERCSHRPRMPRVGRSTSRSKFGEFLVTQAHAMVDQMSIPISYEAGELLTGCGFPVKSVSEISPRFFC